MLANDARDFDAGAVRHVHVHQDQIRIELLEHVQRLARIVDDLGDDLVFRQGAPDQVAGCLRVLHDQNAIRFLLLPLVQFHDVFDDGVRGRACHQAAIAAAPQGLLQLLEIGTHPEADQLAHRKPLPQRLDPAVPLGFGQAAHVEQQQGGGASIVRQGLRPTGEFRGHAEIAELRLQCLPVRRVLSDQPGLADAHGLGGGRLQITGLPIQVGAGRGMGLRHAVQREDAFIEIVQRSVRQRVRHVRMEQRQRDLLQLMTGVVQGRDAFVDEELGEAVDRYRQFDEALEARRHPVPLPCARQGQVFLQEFFRGAEHEANKFWSIFLLTSIVPLYEVVCATGGAALARQTHALSRAGGLPIPRRLPVPAANTGCRHWCGWLRRRPAWSGISTSRSARRLRRKERGRVRPGPCGRAGTADSRG